MIFLSLNNINKNFRVYEQPVDRLKEIILRRPFHRSFQALDNINFTVTKGQTVGVVGDNGAGKSTLLKILAGTLSPSTGEIKKKGTIAALLELGSGFNPELTGRENIYLNATLLGFSSSEIRARESDIIDFSGIHDFIDQPVKTYSSGMAVRLAFSVATSVDPDILIIDEALSVGDQSFQKKCIDRMIDFKNRGNIILFCSHSMYHVNTLCERAIWMESGRIKKSGKSREITREYEDHNREQDKSHAAETSTKVNTNNSEHDSFCQVRRVAVLSEDDEEISEVYPGQDIKLTFEVDIFKDMYAHPGFGVLRSDELLCFCAITHMEGEEPRKFHQGDKVLVNLMVRNFSLLEGAYRVIGGLVDETGLHFYHYIDSPPFKIARDREHSLGLIDFPHSWEIEVRNK